MVLLDLLTYFVSVKTLNISFTEDEYDRLTEKKGDRTWHDAMLDEFEVNNE